METILLETRGPVRWLWLDRPHCLNAITRTTLLELRQAFETIGREDTVRAIVLAAHGSAFCSGFDVRWMAGMDAETVACEINSVSEVFNLIEQCRPPLIAAIQGLALGGGLLLSLVADIRLASENAIFGAPEVKLGIFPSLGLVPRLERSVGIGTAKRMVMVGDTIDAAEAQRIGLVNRMVPAERLEAEAQALAQRLSTLPGSAVQLSKAAFAASRHAGYAEWEREQFAACWASPERETAMRAFLENKSSKT